MVINKWERDVYGVSRTIVSGMDLVVGQMKSYNQTSICFVQLDLLGARVASCCIGSKFLEMGDWFEDELRVLE